MFGIGIAGGVQDLRGLFSDPRSLEAVAGVAGLAREPRQCPCAAERIRSYEQRAQFARSGGIEVRRLVQVEFAQSLPALVGRRFVVGVHVRFGRALQRVATFVDATQFERTATDRPPGHAEPPRVLARRGRGEVLADGRERVDRGTQLGEERGRDDARFAAVDRRGERRHAGIDCLFLRIGGRRGCGGGGEFLRDQLADVGQGAVAASEIQLVGGCATCARGLVQCSEPRLVAGSMPASRSSRW